MLILSKLNQPSPQDLATMLLNKPGVVSIRDLSQGEKPWPYTSSTFGPSYVFMDNLIGDRKLFGIFADATANLVVRAMQEGQLEAFQLMMGMATGGIASGNDVNRLILERSGHNFPFFYYKKEYKETLGPIDSFPGLQLILDQDPSKPAIYRILCFDELINLASTILKAQERFVTIYPAKFPGAVTFLDYETPKSRVNLGQVPVIAPLTLGVLLEVAESGGYFSQYAINDVQDYLRDSVEWQKKIKDLQ